MTAGALRARWGAVDSSLRGLLASDLLTLLAQMTGYIAIPWWIAQRGGARDLAHYGIAIAVATFVSFPLLAPLSERFAKRSQMVLGLAALAAAALLFALLASAGRYELHLLIAIGLGAVVANAFVASASTSIAPELVPADALPGALRLRKTATSIGRLLGPALGGGVLAGAGVASLLWLNLALLVAAALVARRIAAPRGSRSPPSGGGLARWWLDLRGGLVAKWAVPLERGWTLVNFAVWVFIGPAFTMLVPLKVQSLGLSGAWLGACEAALSLGMLLGSLSASDWLVRRFGRYRVRIGAAVCEGLLLALAGWTRTPLLLVLAFAGAGFANTAMTLVGATHRALAIPSAYRVRISAVNVMSTRVANAIGPALAGLALLHWPLDAVYTAFGLVAALLAGGFVLVPRSREFFGLDHAQVTDWYRRQYPDGFAKPGSRLPAGQADAR